MEMLFSTVNKSVIRANMGLDGGESQEEVNTVK